MKKILILLLISFKVYSVNTIYTTINGPSWTTNANWSGGTAPSATGGSNNTYNINNTEAVSGNFNLGSNSIMTLCNTCTLTITGDVTFTNGSTLNIPAGAHLVINGNVTNNNNSNNININGLITINGNFTGGNGSAVTGTGAMAITGTATTTGTGTIFGSTVDCNSTGTCSSSYQDPLPIELLSFNCRGTGEYVIIDWSTASETNNDYFTIERSNDAIYFVNVSIVRGAGNSTSIKTYNIKDLSPSKGINYYRLRQTDYDGKTEVSAIVATKIIDYLEELRVIKITNLFGQEVTEDVNCILVYHFSDGTCVKKYKAQ